MNPTTPDLPDTLPSTFWPTCLKQLKQTMTAATFDAWLASTTAEYHTGKLIIYCKNSYAVQWLGERLKRQIEMVVEAELGNLPIIEFHQRSEAGNQAELFFGDAYRDAYNEIVKPTRVFVGTQYFRQAWLPLLGPVPWLIILELRQRCYWNQHTGEKRDVCEASRKELAAAIGVSEATIKRILNTTDEPLKSHLDRFILDRETVIYRIEGRVRAKGLKFRIRIDDPLTPDDETYLKQIS